MITAKELGKKFVEAREKLNLSVDEAYHQSRIHPKVIKDIESGAYERLGKLYLKSFMKKYALFLGMDIAAVMKEYDSVSSRFSDKEFSLEAIDEHRRGKDRDDVLAQFTEKRIQMALIALLSVVLIVLIFVFLGMIRSRMAPKKVKASAIKVESHSVKQKRQEETLAKTYQTKKPAPLRAVTSKPAEAHAEVTLTLKVKNEEVWLQVKDNGTKIFDGILDPGESRTWTSNGELTVWTGKADQLEFIVNTRKVGTVAAGVVRNIKVSKQGIRIGDVWVNHFE